MIVANRLDDGRVVFLGADRSWTPLAANAAVASTDEGIASLQADADAAEAQNLVISATLVEATTEDETATGTMPAHIKFAMQAKGPSVRPDLGYQVAPNWEG